MFNYESLTSLIVCLHSLVLYKSHSSSEKQVKDSKEKIVTLVVSIRTFDLFQFLIQTQTP